jgi:hypothetical protein
MLFPAHKLRTLNALEYTLKQDLAKVFQTKSTIYGYLCNPGLAEMILIVRAFFGRWLQYDSPLDLNFYFLYSILQL